MQPRRLAPVAGCSPSAEPPGKRQSISQKPHDLATPAPLPDFRNVGVILRVVVVVNLLAALSVLIGVESPGDVPRALVGAAGMLELPLFIVFLLLYLLQPALAKRAAPPVWTVVGGLAVGVAVRVAVAVGWRMVTAVGSWVTVNEMPSSLGWAKKSTKTPKICTGSVVSTSASSSANCAVSRKSILKMAPSMLSSLSSIMSWLLAKRSSLPSSSNSIAQSPG